MDNPILWAIILLAIAAILFFVEIFIPSAGIIAFIAAASLVGGIVMLFRVSTTVGLVGAIVSLAGLPFLFALALKLWPNTPVARWLTLKTPQRADEGGPDAAPSSPQTQLVGVRGKAVSDLRPVGTCLLNGERTECLSESGVIRSGSAVEVVSADGMQVKVKEIFDF